jgi:hypothetical protein
MNTRPFLYIPYLIHKNRRCIKVMCTEVLHFSAKMLYVYEKYIIYMYLGSTIIRDRNQILMIITCEKFQAIHFF